MPQTPFKIPPELLHHITSYLNPQDLFSCIQANHLWNRQCIPHLWHTIDDSTPGWNTILQRCANPKTTHPHALEIDAARVREAGRDKDEEWVRKVFSKYGRFVKVLSVHWQEVLETVSLAGNGGDGAEDGNASGGGGCIGLESLTVDLYNTVQGPREQDSNGHTAPNPNKELTTDPLFPEFNITRDDFTPATPFFGSTAESKQDAFEYGWVLSQHHWHTILKHRGTLKRLHLLSEGQPQWTLRTKEIFFRMMSSLEVLQELTCKFEDAWEVEGVWTLLEVCPRIETLNVMAGNTLRLPDPLPDTIMSARLRTLSLRMLRVSTDEFVTLLRRFPNLSTLSIASIGRPPSSPSTAATAQDITPPQPPQPPSIVNNLSAVGNSLKSLQSLLHDYDHTLSLLPNLVTLLDANSCNRPMSQVIAIHCPKLAVCRSTSNPWYINEYNRTPDDPTNQFLVDCASLKEFNYIEHAIWVDELLRQPWACLGLEWLRCRIVGVSRLSRQEEAIVDRVMTMRKKEVAGESGRVEQQLTEEETAAVEKFHQCERQHHGVYDQLARLTRLKHLDLGYESRYPWTFKHDNTHYEWKGVEYSRYPDGKTFDTLEFSLESGLDRLRALKDLEMIGFECLNHRIGRKELEWMAKSWPRLKLMYGLDEERLYMIERDEERAALKEYFEELRPDVVHDSLFQDNM